MSILAVEADVPVAKEVSLTSKRLVAELEDGRVISVPLASPLGGRVPAGTFELAADRGRNRHSLAGSRRGHQHGEFAGW